MLIRFGMHLDGLQPLQSGTGIGEVTRGPLGLLDLLEVQLGLPPVIATSADTLMAYRACLAESRCRVALLSRVVRARSDQRQPHAAGVARDVVRIRLGRQFSAADAPARLRDLSDVETLAACACRCVAGNACGASSLRSTNSPRRSNASSCSTTSTSCRRCGARCCRNSASKRRPASVPAPHARAGSDLRTCRTRCRSSPRRDRRPRWSRSALARRRFFRRVARRVARHHRAGGRRSHRGQQLRRDDALVIAEHDGIILDNAFERVGLPRAGFQHYSRFRAVTQVLKLALSLLWRPVSPHLLLQFLIHPIGPLPRHVRDELATAVAEQPGLGGGKWREALARIETRMREKFGADEREIARTRPKYRTGSATNASIRRPARRSRRSRAARSCVRPISCVS